MKKITIKCDKGFEDGSCCCNCKNHIPLMKHPMNRGIGEGSISKIMGYTCLGFLSEGEDIAIYFDETHKHGMCEMHQPKRIK